MDAQLLEPVFDVVTPGTLATSRFEEGVLTFVDWSGTLHQFSEAGVLEAVGTTNKSVVSAFVFSQDAQIDGEADQKVVRS